ncbi:hypothetical protein SDC9_144125 [bioreactor metagenome]|uniref:Uncharacterized protein n=1 Tax=bioreactor metagenome TaxID=1076179 RepID=A0A645E625_9ZZZZ
MSPTIISTGCWRCRGKRYPMTISTSNAPLKPSTPIITVWRTSKNGFWNFWRCWRSNPTANPRFSVWSDRRASAKPRSDSRSPGRPTASSCVWPSAGCATRLKSGDTAGLISAHCRDGSSRISRKPEWPTRYSCSTKSTSWPATNAAIRLRRCSRCLIRPRTTVSTITISNSITI